MHVSDFLKVTFQSDIKEEKAVKTSTIENQLQLMNDRINEWERIEEKRSTIIKHRLATFLKYIEDDQQQEQIE